MTVCNNWDCFVLMLILEDNMCVYIYMYVVLVAN